MIVKRAVRLVEHNQERFAKQVRASPTAPGSIVLVPEGADEESTLRRVVSSWPPDGTHAVLARTNRELLVGLCVTLDLGIPFRVDRIPELATDRRVDTLLRAAAVADPRLPQGARVLAAARGIADETPQAAAVGEDEVGADAPPLEAVVAAVLAWLVRWRTLDATAAAVAETRARIAELRRDDAALTLATAHATKGLEFDHVAVVGMTEGRFPSARSLADAADPNRALEEERRLAYVAWTRAKRSLTIVFDPAAPSRFLREAFDADELPIAGGGERSRGPPAGPPPSDGSPRAARRGSRRRQPARSASRRASRRIKSSRASRHGIHRSEGTASASESFVPRVARAVRTAERTSASVPSRSASGIGARTRSHRERPRSRQYARTGSASRAARSAASSIAGSS